MDRGQMRKLAGRDPVGKTCHVDMPEPKKRVSGVTPKSGTDTDTLFAMGEIQQTVKQMLKFARSRNLPLARKEMGRAAGQLGFISNANGWEKEGALLLKVGKYMMRS